MIINPFVYATSGGGSDPNFSSVVTLLHFDGADASTTITDNEGTPKTFTAQGNAQIDTAQSKFGGASLLLDGAGDYVSTPNSADFNFGTGDLTVEFWVRPATVSATQKIVGNRTNTTTGWDIFLDTSGGAFVQGSAGANYIQTAASQLTVNTWAHIAWVRSSGTDTLYINGVSKATGSITANDSSDVLQIGQANFAPAYNYNGHIDEMRITKGVARYTSGFTPPSAAFPNS